MSVSAVPCITEYSSARSWVDERGGSVFPSIDSFAWFVRKHRDELVQSGQYLPRKGSAGALVGPRIEEVVINILTRECVEAVQHVE